MAKKNQFSFGVQPPVADTHVKVGGVNNDMTVKRGMMGLPKGVVNSRWEKGSTLFTSRTRGNKVFR